MGKAEHKRERVKMDSNNNIPIALEKQMWHQNVRVCKDKVVVKLKENGAFWESIIIPTAYYPLTGKLKVFSTNNTEPIQDDRILDLIDDVKYGVGFCYRNTRNVATILRNAGIANVKTYAGWLFTSEESLPVHHAWVVVNDIHIIDLSDEFTTLFALNGEGLVNAGNDVGKVRTAFVSAIQKTQGMKNSIRCAPVGQPTGFLFYVGAECEPEIAKAEYQTLLAKYPDHETIRNVGKDGLNATQRVIRQTY